MKNRNIIKSTILVLAFCLTGVAGANAQVYLTPEDYDNARASEGSLEPNGFVIPDLPGHDSTLDHTPVGNGLWLLGGLAGAYLLNKRRKKDDE